MRRFLLAAGFGFAASGLCACGNGEQDATTTPRGGSGGQGGSSTGSGGSLVTAGTGGGSAGSVSMPPLLDAGMGEADSGSGGASGEFTYPTGCPVPNPRGIAGQKLAIQSFNFDTSELVLKNISTVSQTIVGDRLGWQWCSFPSYWYIAPGNVTVAPGKTYKFILNLNTEGTWQLPPEGSELAVYVQSGTFDESDKMVSFVSWGDGLSPVGAGREYVAVLANLWAQNSRVDIGSADSGFVATGSVMLGSGYQGVPKRCLVAPPNE